MNRKNERRTTIIDVARACNVAPSTVSNAFSNKRYVHQKTRKRILKVAEELGYQASFIAQSLRLQRSWTIGLVLADISNPFYPEVVHGVEDVVLEEGWNLFLCNTDYQEEKQARYIDALIKRQVDGIILASLPNQQSVAHLQRSGVPCVLLNKGHEEIDLDYVGIDNRRGISLAFDHLIELGHKRIAFIQGHVDSYGAMQRFEAYVDCLKNHGLAFNKKMCARGAYDFSSGYNAARQLISQADRPSAIISANDSMALGAISRIIEAGLRVPEDISIIGFDDVPAASLPRMDLTTIRVPKRSMGISAARLLMTRIKNAKVEGVEKIVTPVELIMRKTTGQCKD